MLKDPHFGGPKPPFRMPRPGADLDPKPDHGEHTYLGSSRLQNYAAIVLGGESGIGRAVAIAFAREGANVLLGYQADRKGAEETARWISEAGRRAALCPGDPNSEDYHHLLVEQALRQFGSLDILVSDAPSNGQRWARQNRRGHTVRPGVRIRINPARRRKDEAGRRHRDYYAATVGAFACPAARLRRLPRQHRQPDRECRTEASSSGKKPRSLHCVVPGSAHYVQLDKPLAVIDADSERCLLKGQGGDYHDSLTDQPYCRYIWQGD